MKKLAVFLLLLSAISSFGQMDVYLKDKGRIMTDSLVLSSKYDGAKYKKDGKTETVPVENVDSLVFGKQVFKPIIVRKMPELASVLVTKGNQMLALQTQDRIRSRGGFESRIKVYKVFFVEDGKVMDTFSCTNSHTDPEVKQRKKLQEFLSAHIRDCPVFLDYVNRFTGIEDPQADAVINLLENPENQKCH